jgi:energy-coupling factor transporter ATP-binding protein EcfA2
MVGMVFQDPESQFCMLRAEDEVAFGLENLSVPRVQMQPRVDRALAEVGLTGLGGTRIERLSGGQKQRLALAAVLVMEPRTMVFDEPTANLDPLSARDFFNRLRQLRGQRSMVIVEHRVEHALELADRVLVLGPDGAPAAFGTPQEVLRARWRELAAGGVWLPEVAELALEKSPLTGTVPLSVDEAATQLAGWQPPTGPRSRRTGATVPAVQVRGLTFGYSEEPNVLRDVNCELPEGRLTAIVGPNGSGKTTLVAHLAGIHAPPAGAVMVFGRDGRTLARHPDPQTVGFVFQNPEHQFLTHRVFDEVAWGLRRLRLPEREIVPRVEAELASLGLAHLGVANPYSLSGGEKRRLSLATALVLTPRLLVLDEPTFGQDRATSAALATRLRSLVDGGTTVVIVTHDMRLVATEADHVVLLVGGRVAYQGPPARLLADDALLARGRLVRPPLLELARRLGIDDPPLTLASVAGWLMSTKTARAVA